MSWPNYNSWPDELSGRLKQLWADGLSASRIGVIIGKSRNAVIGRARRLELPPRAPRKNPMELAERRKRPSGYQRYVAKHGPKPKVRPMEPIEEPVPLNIPFAEIADHGQCKFLYGDGPFLACGHPTAESSSYCAYHHRLCWHPRDEKARPYPVIHSWKAAA